MAFTPIGGKDWTGGQNYLLNLLSALVRYQHDRIKPVLFAGEDASDDIVPFVGLSGVEIIHTPLLNRSRRTNSLIQALVFGRDHKLEKLLREAEVALVFEAARFFGWRLAIPAIAWIPDFQHKRLPQLFSRFAYWKREIGFRAQVFGGRTIMLSSDDARITCERYYPSTRGRTRTLHFAVPPGPSIDLAQARAVADSYGLPERFFFMPNQFWQHKNHGLVLDALEILRQRGIEVVVAASGKQNDPRVPTYFPALQKRIKQAGLQNSFRLLGMIPHADVLYLLRACTALLNPSLSEGWSTTVEEARSMGTPMLLSDLDVHREQMGDGAVYFNRFSSKALADALASFVPLDESERSQKAKMASEAAIQRVAQFALEFADLVDWCLAKRVAT